MKRTAMKAILAVLAGVFGVGTAAAETGGSGGFSSAIREFLIGIVQKLPPELQQQISELLLNSGLL
ncbi:hypothetical protein [Halorientalis pallida]|uniref:Uncharacterized protein n=1 Tax=Halorientalis pallida TaxID=2479928 RepID=A0A498KRH0_9EURY|nr:hypothetical protein [Halorientalis pallida]RXK46707.1 hypothetical protein EAF64_18720 [Halorientalis pallida]